MGRARETSGPPGQRRYHYHAPGVMYVAVTLFLAVGALNSQNNLLFAALGLGIGGLLVSGMISGASLLGVRVEREPLGRQAVGEPMLVRYLVTNANRIMPAFGLSIAELDGLDSGGRPATWRRFFPAPGAFVAHVGPGETVRAEALVWPRTRGALTFDAVRVASRFPFGLTRKSITFSRPQRVVVFPASLPLKAGLVERLTTRTPSGVGAERVAGAGDEFFGLREYVPGDSPRRIAWKPSARTGEMVVRQHAMPSPVRLVVVVRLPGGDAREGTDRGVRMERAIVLGASILREAEGAGVAVGLAIPSLSLFEPARTGRRHLDRLLTEMALVEAGPWEGSDAFPEAAAMGGACVVVHSGAADPGYGPRHARHLEAGSLTDHVAAGESASLVLPLLLRAGALEAGPRGWRGIRRVVRAWRGREAVP